MDLTIAELLISQFEGFRSKPYLCPAGIPTIGYGSTYYLSGQRVTLNDQLISQEEALLLLRATLAKDFLPGVLRMCPRLTNDNKKLNAIVDFTYNLGVGNLQVSTLRRKINEGKWAEAQVQLLRWNKAQGKVLKGLTLRRQVEAALFN